MIAYAWADGEHDDAILPERCRPLACEHIESRFRDLVRGAWL